MPALKPSFYALERNQDVFSWDAFDGCAERMMKPPMDANERR